jgi:hypothetical protein
MCADGCVAVLAHGSFDGRPTHQSAALLGDMAPSDFLVGLAVAGSQSGPAGQMPGALEPRDITDLGNEDGAQGRADSGNGLDALIAEVAGQPWADLPLEHGNFAVDVLNQIAE